MPDDDLPDEAEVTRADDLRALIARLQLHGHQCIDSTYEFEAATLLIAAAEGIKQAVEKLEDVGTADDPFEGRAPASAEG
jgi:hypothetical protein